MLQLSELSKYREGNRLEVKKAEVALPKSLWPTYSAFANTNGGVILLGVDEAKDKSLVVVGLLDPAKIISEFWNGANNRQNVNVNILTDRDVYFEEVDGKTILVVEVPRANRTDKPVYIGSDPFAGSYRRNGEGDYHCTADEVRNMMRDQANVSQDTRVLEQLDLDAFDYESVRRYRTRLQNIRPDHVWENLEPTLFLQKLGCIGRAEDGSLHPTAAGVLMFGFEYEIVKEYPAYFLDYQEHDDETTRWTDRIVSNLGDWSGNLCDFYFRVCNRITQDAKTPFKLEGMTRVDDTPVHKALRYALANALIHAYYYDRLGLVIHRSSQSITIANPGGLRISLEDALGGGMSDPRNFTLFKLFNMLSIGERAGSGIPNIYHVWESQGWQMPKFEEKLGPDRIILSLVLSQSNSGKLAIKSSDKEKLAISDKQKQQIVEYLTAHEVCKSKELADLFGVTGARVRVLLSQLVEDGIIVADGANRNRTYRLNSQG
jgi:predicted HTH transcriptional regulator